PGGRSLRLRHLGRAVQGEVEGVEVGKVEGTGSPDVVRDLVAREIGEGGLEAADRDAKLRRHPLALLLAEMIAREIAAAEERSHGVLVERGPLECAQERRGAPGGAGIEG